MLSGNIYLSLPFRHVVSGALVTVTKVNIAWGVFMYFKTRLVHWLKITSYYILYPNRLFHRQTNLLFRSNFDPFYFPLVTFNKREINLVILSGGS